MESAIRAGVLYKSSRALAYANERLRFVLAHGRAGRNGQAPRAGTGTARRPWTDCFLQCLMHRRCRTITAFRIARKCAAHHSEERRRKPAVFELEVAGDDPLPDLEFWFLVVSHIMSAPKHFAPTG